MASECPNDFKWQRIWGRKTRDPHHHLVPHSTKILEFQGKNWHSLSSLLSRKLEHFLSSHVREISWSVKIISWLDTLHLAERILTGPGTVQSFDTQRVRNYLSCPWGLGPSTVSSTTAHCQSLPSDSYSPTLSQSHTIS